MEEALKVLRFFRTADIADAEEVLDVVRVLVAARRSVPTAPVRTAASPAGARPTVRDGTIDILRRHGKPMHASDITAELQRASGEGNGEGNAWPSHGTVVSGLARLAKAENTFHRTGPNIFGLLEWLAVGELENQQPEETARQGASLTGGLPGLRMGVSEVGGG